MAAGRRVVANYLHPEVNTLRCQMGVRLSRLENLAQPHVAVGAAQKRQLEKRRQVCL